MNGSHGEEGPPGAAAGGTGSAGSFNPSYVGRREDVERLVPEGARRVLDFGCSNGALGGHLKAVRPEVTVWGVELDGPMAEEARGRLDRVIQGDLNDVGTLQHLDAGSFDVLIFADVLEHLVDPWTVSTRAVELLERGGHAILCLPNIRHYTTIWNLMVRGYWPYRDRGIHDRTHLRHFTLRNARELVSQAGLEIRRVERNYRILERPHALNGVSRAFALPGLKELLTFQHLILAQRP